MESSGRPAALLPLIAVAMAAALALALGLAAAPASAQTAFDPSSSAATTSSSTPTALQSLPPLDGPATPPPVDVPARPSDFSIDGKQAVEIADTDPNVQEIRKTDGQLTSSLEIQPGIWEVGFFSGGKKVVLVEVNGSTGEIENSFTGSAVDWPMARGREGQFGHLLNAPWVWIPLAAVFFFSLFDFRRPGRIAHLDLLVLLSFGISEAFFNAAEIGISVPLYYPPLLYLLGRMLWIGFRGPTAVLRPTMAVRWAVILCIVLAVFRVTLNIADSGVIDVGYAGEIGADRITHGQPIYGADAFPDDNQTGDTYGPTNYFAYVPFEAAMPWSGSWDELPAAHTAAIFFDVMCLIGLIVLGRRLGGDRLAATLALGWLAYPFSDYVLQSNSNDSLLAAFLIWSFVLFAQPMARGGMLALAATAKFVPFALAPLMLAGERGLGALRHSRAAWRPVLLATGAFVVVSILMFAHPAIDPGLSVFWERTVKSQIDRVSPFSVWGQADLGGLHTAFKLLTVALAIAVAFVPRRRDIVRIAALAAAVMIAVEINLEHWFYLYIVWFLPMYLLAISWRGAAGPDPVDEPVEAESLDATPGDAVRSAPAPA